MFKSRKLAIFLLLFTLITPPLSISKTSERTPSKTEEALMCLCGCNQTIKNCPHENCGFAIPAREKIDRMIKDNKTDEDIMDAFLLKYGDEILATPKKEGFNLLGYVMPFVALLIAVGAIITILRKWSSRGIKDEESTLPLIEKEHDSDMDKKIEKELDEMD
ncbi:MAG: cytochrome c-type biogenesis protein CcmH [Proteobacteria bacterium]|nr:cytochrome c-type biogenesis protein CcmH [Pseudomonadota bacterium]